jgi:hypothetical protein
MFVLMSNEAARRAALELQMMEGLVDCAQALALAFGRAAQAETDWMRRLQLGEAFQKSFQAVRLGIQLSIRLRAAPKPARPEREVAERDPPETEAPDWTERGERAERERDRDHEPVSLPKFLATLGVVAKDGERLGDQLPADVRQGALPALNKLLSRAAPVAPPARPAADLAVLTRPPPATSRAALLGSASRPLSLEPRSPRLPRPPPRRSG